MLKPARGRQRGAVLIVGLIVLTVMTLMVLGMLKSAVLELKIGGAAQNAEVLFSTAESAANKFLNDNNGRFSKECLTAAGALSCFTTADASTVISGAAPNLVATSAYSHGAVVVATAAVTLQQIACTDVADTENQIGGGLQVVYFDIQSVVTGAVSGQATVHQGIKSLLPPGSC